MQFPYIYGRARICRRILMSHLFKDSMAHFKLRARVAGMHERIRDSYARAAVRGPRGDRPSDCMGRFLRRAFTVWFGQ